MIYTISVADSDGTVIDSQEVEADNPKLAMQELAFMIEAGFVHFLSCTDPICQQMTCPEHSEHLGDEHTYQMHHHPSDHLDKDGNPDPDSCRCTVYLHVPSSDSDDSGDGSERG